MSAGLTPFSAGAVVTAASVRSRLDETQDYLNGGVVATDLRTTAKWVKPSMIERPKFFVSGTAGRAVAATRDVYWQNTGPDLRDGFVTAEDVRSDDWVIVHGCSRQFYVNPPRYGASANVLVRCVFSAYETQANSGGGAFDNDIAATFALALDGTDRSDTVRTIYSAVDTENWKAARKTHVVAAWFFDTAAGAHTASLLCKVNANAATGVRVWNRIWVRSRMLRVDVQYL